MTGDGVVDVHVKTPGANVVSIQGAPLATLDGADLSLAFNDGLLAVSATSPQGVQVQHNVTVSDGAAAVASSRRRLSSSAVRPTTSSTVEVATTSSTAAAAQIPRSIPAS